jgi:ACT domain-containing protein
MPEKRKAQRRKMVLPVKVFVDQTTHLAHTVDITENGARLGALRMELQPGAIISLQRGSQRAKFQIAWIRQLAPNELQAGIESLQPQNSFWGVDLSARVPELKKESQQALMTLLSGRSKAAARK